MSEFVENPKLGERFQQALLCCCHWHRYQVRKQGEVPYVAHLLAVAARVLRYGGTEDEAIAALLHDVVEDVNIRLTTVADLFGAQVAEIVAGCTESEEIPKPPKRERRLRYIEQIRNGSVSVALISACDKADNLADFLRSAIAPDGVFSIQTQEDTLWFYEQILPIYKQKLASRTPDLLKELTSNYELLKGYWGNGENLNDKIAQRQ